MPGRIDALVAWNPGNGDGRMAGGPIDSTRVDLASRGGIGGASRRSGRGRPSDSSNRPANRHDLKPSRHVSHEPRRRPTQENLKPSRQGSWVPGGQGGGAAQIDRPQGPSSPWEIDKSLPWSLDAWVAVRPASREPRLQVACSSLVSRCLEKLYPLETRRFGASAALRLLRYRSLGFKAP